MSQPERLYTDVKFYETCEKLLRFAQNAHKMFLYGSVEDKRFITQTILSKATYHDGNFDVELHPAFDALFRLSKNSEQKQENIELAETQADIKKEPTKEALNLNGGNDEARTRDLMRDRHAL